MLVRGDAAVVNACVLKLLSFLALIPEAPPVKTFIFLSVC